ncbi:MAG: GNAT family N-acetyltransferase [Streptosporangiaceae bacterium]
MQIEQLDLADIRRRRACHQTYLAAQRVDEPEGPWFTEEPFGGWLSVGWSGEPQEVWAAPGPVEGSVAGWYRLELPGRENLDKAHLDVVVHPAERQRGLGRALLRHASARAAANHRSELSGTARDGSPGAAFAGAAGAAPGMVDIMRVLDVHQLDRHALAQLRTSAERAAAGYELVSWIGPVPEEFIEQAAGLYNAANDAPHDPGTVPEEWDARRVRERVNALRPRYGLHFYTEAARHADTGELAGLTEMAVDPADPGWGHQVLTVVARKHRGHRLGLRLKLAMLQLLATTEPQLRRLETFNAQANTHMIAINEALGYQPYGPPVIWFRLDVTMAPGVLPASG